MNEDAGDLVERLDREVIERLRLAPPAPPPERPARPEKGLPDAELGSPTAEECGLFRREVRGLIFEGSRGRFALVRVGQPVTVWDTMRDAVQAGELLFGQAPCLVQEVQPYLRPLHGRHLEACRA
jgi:hypothetical protein